MVDESKTFATLAAEYALRGFALVRAQPGITHAPFYACKWGWLKPIHSLDDARRFLSQITGAR